LTNLKVTFGYDGTGFSGSQRQPAQRTVEGELLLGLEKLYQQSIDITISGRTDSGVHASGQVFNFNAPKNIPEANLKDALNSILPEDIQVLNIETVDNDFNARFSARSREYKYILTQGELPLTLRNFIATYPKFPIDMELLNALCRSIIGVHEFTHFKCTGSNERHDNREIIECSARQINLSSPFSKTDIGATEITFHANSFLYRMVRNLVGAMIEVLRGKQTLNSFKGLLNPSQERFLYTTAPAKGLSLIKVNY